MSEKPQKTVLCGLALSLISYYFLVYKSYRLLGPCKKTKKNKCEAATPE